MIGYAGLSHLGLISSLAAADKGFNTVGYDPDSALVDGLNAGKFNVSEPGLDSLYARARGKIRFSADPGAFADCSVVYVAVDVPTAASGRSNAAPVVSLVTQVTDATKRGTVIVVLSQVPPGFTRQLSPAVRATGHELLYQVETLIFGRAVERALHPERYIVGMLDPTAPLPAPMEQFLKSFGCPILPMRLESAELTKIAINMFLVSSVSTTNMLAEICERIGADWGEIAPALRLDRRIGESAYLSPGLGIGGGNLSRDMATIQVLAGDNGTDAGLIDAWRRNSSYRRDWALRELHRTVLATTANPTIAVWGLAYKEDTHSTFNSPSIELLSALTPYTVRAYDPVATLPDHLARTGLTVHENALEACEGADALAIMTPWRAFTSIDAACIAAKLRGRLVIDPFGVLSGGCDAAGLLATRLGTGENRGERKCCS